MSGDCIFEDLKARLSAQSSLRRDEPLARRTTFRVGGVADFLAEPASEEDLVQTIRFCRERGLASLVLGRGSNLLIRDGGIRGVVISLSQPGFGRIEAIEGKMRCGAGARLNAVATEACRNGLQGFEFMEGIPGSVGGALRMNAGATGRVIFDCVESMRVMSRQGEVTQFSRAEIDVAYRSCSLLKTYVALGATFWGEPGARQAIAERMGAMSRKRWASQPKEPSAGCVFKNPLAIAAGKLIDELGLKGTRIGGAAVSAVHGNFIVNMGAATARDVLSLIDLVKEKARQSRGIELETEVEILGED